MALLYGRNLLDTLHERVGEEEDGRFRADPENGKLGWGRIIGRQRHATWRQPWACSVARAVRDTTTHSSACRPAWTFTVTTVRTDHAIRLVPTSRSAAIGAASRISAAAQGDSNFTAYTLGGYWTHFGPTGWYLDAILHLARLLLAGDDRVAAERRLGAASSCAGAEAVTSAGFEDEPFA